jgi:hypothetical protein
MLSIGEGTPKTSMEPPQGEERKRKKEEEGPMPYWLNWLGLCGTT